MIKNIGKYEILSELGRGGMGVVYRGYDSLIDREVAIKVISDVALEIPEIKTRFYREARTAGRLSHENITIVHDVGEADGKPYIVMEYLAGSDLRSLLEQHVPMTLSRKLDIGVQICRALAYSHSKEVIHRDIKPANIQIVDDRRVKIMDFGIAKLVSSNMTSPGAIMGTPYYMSPEQVRGHKIDHRSDMFSVGVLLYELFTSKRPFNADEPTTVMYKIVHEEPEQMTDLGTKSHSGLNDIVIKMLRKNPDERYNDLYEVAEQLEVLLADVRTEEKGFVDAAKEEITRMLNASKDHLGQGNLEKALDLAHKASSIDPGSATVAQLIKEIRVAQERRRIRQELEAEFRTASKLQKGRKYQEAINILEAIVEQEAEYPEATKLLNEARESLRIEEQKKKIEELLSRCNRLLQSDNLQQAEDLVGEILRLEPENTVARKLLQSVTKQKAIASEEEQRKAFIHEQVSRGREMLVNGLFDDAIEVFKSAQKLDPKNPDIKSLLKEALTQKAHTGKKTDRRLADQDATHLVGRSPEKPASVGDETRLITPPLAEKHLVQRKVPELQKLPRRAPSPKPTRSRRRITMVIGLAVIALCFAVYRLFIYAPPLPMGYVALNVAPWAEVTKIERKDGGEIHLDGRTLTPCRLSLPAGEYTIHLSNPDFGQPMSLTVSVQERTVQEINKTMAGFDYMKLVSEF